MGVGGAWATGRGGLALVHIRKSECAWSLPHAAQAGMAADFGIPISPILFRIRQTSAALCRYISRPPLAQSRLSLTVSVRRRGGQGLAWAIGDGMLGACANQTRMRGPRVELRDPSGTHRSLKNKNAMESVLLRPQKRLGSPQSHCIAGRSSWQHGPCQPQSRPKA